RSSEPEFSTWGREYLLPGRRQLLVHLDLVPPELRVRRAAVDRRAVLQRVPLAHLARDEHVDGGLVAVGHVDLRAQTCGFGGQRRGEHPSGRGVDRGTALRP